MPCNEGAQRTTKESSRVRFDKPNSVREERGAAGPQPLQEHHLSGRSVARCVRARPTRVAIWRAAISLYSRNCRACDAAWPCTPWGLPGRTCCHARRGALTSPFHPLPVPRPQSLPSAGQLSVAHAVIRGPKPHGRLPVRKHGALWCSDFPHRHPRRATERCSKAHAREGRMGG